MKSISGLEPFSSAGRQARDRENWHSVLLVILVTLLTYAPLIPHLGFYRDDWYLIRTAQTQGAEGIMSLFKGDRPFLGWLYIFDYNLLGSSPLNWHLYVLFIKALSALAFLWLMRSLWPHKKIETTFITLLFVVYPGFYQQPNAATFKNLLLAYGAAMLSLALTIQALKARSIIGKVGATLLAVLLAAFYIFIYEALIGIEAARLLLIWYYLQPQGPRDWKMMLRKTAMASIPYLAFAAGFVFWRVFLFHSTRRSTNVDVVFDSFSSLTLHNVARLLIEMAKDLIETTILAWSVPYYQFINSQGEYRTVALGVILALFVIAASGAYYFFARNRSESFDGVQDNTALEAVQNPERDWIVLGAVITFVTTVPIILAGRNVIFGIQWDRYTYQSILGAALFMGGIIFYAVRGRLRWILCGALLFTGVLTQFFSAEYYRSFWILEREAMWQLSWRAPNIADGTTLVLALPPGYRLAEEYEVWGPVNLVYHPNEPLKLAGQIILDDLWVDLARGKVEDRVVRGTVSVTRDYGKAIILSQPSPRSCLHVLDGKRFEQTISEPFEVQLAAKYSDVELINAEGAPVIPSSAIFGPEPPHGWCYFYQSIDLARQKMDWLAASNFADQAILLGLEPSDVSEWLPALEAYIHINDTQKAKQIARLIRADKHVLQSICEQMKALQSQPAGYDRDRLSQALCTAN
jgi:hypothetical protein